MAVTFTRRRRTVSWIATEQSWTISTPLHTTSKWGWILYSSTNNSHNSYFIAVWFSMNHINRTHAKYFISYNIKHTLKKISFSGIGCLSQGTLSRLFLRSTPDSRPVPVAVPAREGLQEHGPGYDSEPAAQRWEEFTVYTLHGGCMASLPNR